MKVSINKNIRIHFSKNCETLRYMRNNWPIFALDDIEGQTRLETMKKNLNKIKDENDQLVEQMFFFEDEAKKLLMSVDTDTQLRIETQTGSDNTRISTYNGKLRNKFKSYDTTFDFISPDMNNSKPFTIALNCCLLSIEVVKY